MYKKGRTLVALTFTFGVAVVFPFVVQAQNNVEVIRSKVLEQVDLRKQERELPASESALPERSSFQESEGHITPDKKSQEKHLPDVVLWRAFGGRLQFHRLDGQWYLKISLSRV